MAYVKHAVEPREDLLGHLGHIAVVERKWLTVSRGLTGELVRSLNRVLQAWLMLPETCVYCIVCDDDVRYQTAAA